MPSKKITKNVTQRQIIYITEFHFIAYLGAKKIFNRLHKEMRNRSWRREQFWGGIAKNSLLGLLK